MHGDRRPEHGRAASYVAEIVGASGRNRDPRRPIRLYMRWRIPPPLACAAMLAAAIAMSGPPAPVAPANTTPDDRSDDRIVGVVQGPLVRTPHGVGAPIATGHATL